jgi:ABC-type spermidine/putrescine transport system permease subunit II
VDGFIDSLLLSLRLAVLVTVLALLQGTAVALL